MRFIGSKTLLLKEIEKVIAENTSGNEVVFCDMFSGSAAVARHFKSKYKIISNDLLFFSYILQKATIKNNSIPDFSFLKQKDIKDPLAFLEEEFIDKNAVENKFISQNYAPNKKCERKYLSQENALRVDFIRTIIEDWKKQKSITQEEYDYLLAVLIEGVPFVSNITGTYGAYLKDWDKRALRNLELTRLNVVDNGYENEVYNLNANELITKIEGDILYLDPPYNSRQYCSNYHLLETIAKYDNPKIKGKTGIRDCENEKSKYCIKKEVLNSFSHLIENAKFNNIIVSYNSDGLMTSDEIEKILKKYGKSETFKRYEFPYRRYKSKIIKEKDELKEYIFFIKKEIKKKKIYVAPSKKTLNLIVDNKKFIKSPLNYIGGKYKLLPQIIPLFPKKIENFIDLFSGGFNVGLNVEAKKIFCNDINFKIIELYEYFSKTNLEEILEKIDENIKKYNLSKTNKQGFLEFRDYYNQSGLPIDLYSLTCFSFNYQFRFNNQHKYNNPFGENKSHFSEQMRNNLIKFVNRMQKKDIVFSNKDFANFDMTTFNSNDLIYCDPPYLITTGSYNDGKRGFKNWSEKEEYQLLGLLDELNKRNIRFALSNVLEHKGKVNKVLFDWSKKYKIHYLNNDYSNSCYNTKKGNSKEVLIVNY